MKILVTSNVLTTTVATLESEPLNQGQQETETHSSFSHGTHVTQQKPACDSCS